MRRICLTLPTNRACAEAITAIGEEAAYAAGHFDVEVHLLILDSSAAPVFAAHAAVVRELPAVPGVVVHHFDEAVQRDFLRQVIHRAGPAKPDLMLDLMLPAALSYGACTNRAFLIAAALGCESVHRRDSDSRYQTVDGVPVFPVHHELTSIGSRAADAVGGVTRSTLDARYADRPVTMVGASFVGELSVDIGDILERDRDVYLDMVGLWAPAEWSAERKRELAEESFLGAGAEVFTRDDSTLTVVDPMRVDMCNISFHRVHESVPLPPATDTIGSDYFLMHLVESAALPGVLHNRHIVNYYTGERRTPQGFIAYQTRFVKFVLSMLYLNHVYDRMAQAGESLLDDQYRVRASVVAGFVRESTGLDRSENVARLDSLDRSYCRLGDRYAQFADVLAARRERLLAEAQQDTEDFALLIEAWEPMVAAARLTRPRSVQRQPDRGSR
ncbi:DUF6271 family protein [Streptantibioticus silvisoli]|uniref:DUF6271 family protein n=1 Tax=Streptantibioticus silvisoli TaxID=2705255 RepID=A0ABT6W5U9_9ACTN|nr:DUF6271 family protein [Streptantibioticus silvisoli]MDI5965659.1 DUF6271 family protein [Streptantibioticus silvisoli]